MDGKKRRSFIRIFDNLQPRSISFKNLRRKNKTYSKKTNFFLSVFYLQGDMESRRDGLNLLIGQ